MPKLIVKLTQCTPLLHFQSDQLGASLRATEVKPLLDRFLVARYGKDTIEPYRIKPRLPENKKLDPKKLAYNYRVVVSQMDDTNNDITIIKNLSNYPCWIRNKSATKGRMLGRESTLTMTIHSIHHELIELIKAIIVPFFRLNNFGFSKGKGFGGFLASKIDNESPQDMELSELVKYVDKLRYPLYTHVYAFKSTYIDWDSALSAVKTIHKRIKTGALERHVPYLLGGGRSPSPFIYKLHPENGQLRVLLFVRKDEVKSTRRDKQDLIQYLDSICKPGIGLINKLYPTQEVSP